MNPIKTMLAVAAVLLAAGAQGQALQSCYKSKWGPDDQRGAMNNVTAAHTLAAIKLVKRGKAIRSQAGRSASRSTRALPSARTRTLTRASFEDKHG